MQAFSVTIFNPPYAAFVQTGRPSKEPRTEFGQRLLAAREASGLSQAQVAEQLGITQKAYAVWERYPVALRPEQIEKVTSASSTVSTVLGRRLGCGGSNSPAQGLTSTTSVFSR